MQIFGLGASDSSAIEQKVFNSNYALSPDSR